MMDIAERVQRYLDILSPHVRIREQACLTRELLETHKKALAVVDAARNLIDFQGQDGAVDAWFALERALRAYDGNANA